MTPGALWYGARVSLHTFALDRLSTHGAVSCVRVVVSSGPDEGAAHTTEGGPIGVGGSDDIETDVRVLERRSRTEFVGRTEGNVSEAARQACITRSHLFKMLKRHGLK